MVSPITWNWSNPYQATEIGNELCIKQAEMIGPDDKCRRTMGLALALSISAIVVATAVAALGEYVIKGLGNIFGCCCNQECKFLTGVSNLLLSVVAIPSMAATAPFVVIAMAVGIVVLPLWTFIHPDSLYDLITENLTDVSH